MKITKSLLALILGLLCMDSYADGAVSVYKYKKGRKLPRNTKIHGTLNVELKYKQDIYGKTIKTDRSFYGIDLHGFSSMPHEVYVLPLKSGHFRWGGNLHSVYNWEENSYYDKYDENFYYVYASNDRRIVQVQKKYKSNPLMQVNLMGWQPSKENNLLVLRRSANAQHAANQLFFLNLEKGVGLVDVLVGNEPFYWKDTHSKVWQGGIPTADEYIERFVKYVLALRSAQEEISGNANDINIWGPEMATSWVDWQTMNLKDCTYDYSLPERYKCSYGDGKFSHFIPYFLSRLAEIEADKELNPKGYKLLNYLSFHYYPLFRTDFDDDGSVIRDSKNRYDVNAMLESTNIWNKADYVNKYDSSSPKGVKVNLVNKFIGWRDLYYPSAKLAITEFGVDSKASISYHPIVRPLYLADLMGRVREAGVDVFVKSFLKNGNDGSSNEWSLIDSRGRKTPLYNIYQLYSNNFIGESLNVIDTFEDKVNAYSVYAQKTLRGKLVRFINVFVVNKSTKVKNINLMLTKNSVGLNESDLELALTPWSLTLIQIPTTKNGRVLVKQYGAKEMNVSIGEYKED